MSQKRADTVFPSEIIGTLTGEIAGNAGNEVFFHIRTNGKGEITGAEALSWGNETSTAALLQHVAPGDIVVHNHPSGLLVPSDPDVQIASVLGNQGIGFYIVDNAVEEVKIVVDRYISSKRELIDIDEVARTLSEESAIAGALPEYECRPGQIEMAAEVSRCFNDGLVALIEAGTGTGKTLAYLIPAIRWALANKERVLISTNTINLQEQLIFKDIPFLHDTLEQEFTAVLVKGRQNYACLRRAEHEERELAAWQKDAFEKGAFEKGDEELKTLFEWTKKTADGSLSDLNFIPKPDVWDRIKCESDTCTGARCVFYEDCFLVRARRRAAKADLLVVNHHLLFADLSLRGSLGSLSDVAVLPPYTRIIIDEAHHIESVCTDYFGTQVTQFGMKRLLGRLSSLNRRKEQRGLLPLLRRRLQKVSGKAGSEQITALVSTITDELIPGKEALAKTAEDFFLDVAAFLEKTIRQTGDERQFRMDERFHADEEWNNMILVKGEALIKGLRKYTQGAGTFLESLAKTVKKHKEQLENSAVELGAQFARIGALSDALYYLLFENDARMVKWIEETERYRSIRLSAAPIEVAESLNSVLFTPFETVVMTSATLSVGGTFDFIRSRLGLDRVDRDRAVSRLFPSPFDFRTQALIGIPLDGSAPDNRRFPEFAHSAIERSLEISGGRAFVLFTSYNAMNAAFETVSERIDSMGMLKQGADTRHNILNRFRREQPAALFATDSFWEGVDVIGEALQSIVITRLPFRVPTVPIEVARREAIDNAGGNSFTDYTVPQAVIKFKQGFGRLIRHKNDVGTILVLDNRILSKFYGKVFLASLPECGFVSGDSDTVFAAFERFFGER